MYKLYNLIIILLCLLLPGLSLSATTDFVASSDITVADVIYGDTTTNLTIISGANAQSWTFDGGVFTVVNPGTGSAAFKVSCNDSSVYGIKITNSSDSAVACVKNSTAGTSSVTVPSTADTYTVTPVSTNLSNSVTYNSACGAETCNSGYHVSGSGASATCVQTDGGGGVPGSVSTLNLPIPRLQTIYPDGTIVYHDEEITEIPTEQILETTTSIVLPSFVFNKLLKEGMENDEVKKLQEFLATDSSLYPEALVTGYYGAMTKRAVQKFQEKYGIVSSGTPSTTGYGLVGPQTRVKLNEIFGGITSTSTPMVATTTKVSAIFTFGMGLGMSNSDIKRLQQLLNSDSDTIIALSGVGSVGQETEYYGLLTKQAVQKFQMKYNIVNGASDIGYGYVGPKTRAKLNEIFGEGVPSASVEGLNNSEIIPSAPEDTSSLEAQIKDMIEQVQLLQTQLNAI